MPLTLPQIARALGGEISGRQILAPGPGHSAKDRSLSIRLDDRAPGGFVVHSFAGDDPLACRDYVRQRAGLPAFKPGEQFPTTKGYLYRLPDGSEAYKKVRAIFDGGSKTFWMHGRGTPVLYGCERLADLAEGAPVFIVEGEAKVDRLYELGVIAVCTDAGAQSKWLPQYADLLRGLDIILWPDSDEAGEKYIANAAKCLQGHVASLRVVRPFGPPNGGKGLDVCDWEGNAEALARLVETAAPYEPIAASTAGHDSLGAKAESKRFEIIPFDEITFDATPLYLVKGLLCSTGIVVVWGPPKCGKSFFVFDLVMHVALGWEYRGQRVRQGTVVYCALEGCAAFKNRIEAFRQKHLAENSSKVPFYLMASPMSLIADQAALVASIRDAKAQPAVVVIDTLNRSLAGSENSDEDMSRYIQAADTIRLQLRRRHCPPLRP